MDNLKPCPFCGGEAKQHEVPLERLAFIICSDHNCLGYMQVGWGKVDDKDWFVKRLRDNWNRRPNNWIPVSEKMPRAYHAVLVYCPEYMNAYCASLNADGQWLYFAQDVSRIVSERVTHWMPLPEPPKEVVE